MRFSESYREIRASMADEAEKYTNELVGYLTRGDRQRVEWTRTFLKQMNKLAARI